MQLNLSPRQSADTFAALTRIWGLDNACPDDVETQCRRASVAEIVSLCPEAMPVIAEYADAVDELIGNFQIEGIRLAQLARIIGDTTIARLACSLAGLVRRTDANSAITYWDSGTPPEDRKTVRAFDLTGFRFDGECFVGPDGDA